MVMRRPERKKQQPGSYYNPFVPPNLPTYPAQPMPAVPSARMPQLSPQPAVPSVRMPQLSPQPAVPSVPMPQFGQRGAAAPPPAPAAKLPVPKKMNTETNAQYQARLQRLGANRLLNPPAAPPVPSTGGLQKLNTESNAQFEARKLRDADGYTPPPSRANLNPTSPSDAMQPRQRDYFGEQAVEGSLDQLDANSRSSILQTESPQRDFYDRTGTTPLFTPGLMPAAPTRVPVAPGVNEELLSRLPSRSERDRATMQPGGMGFTEPVEDDGYRFKGSGATPGVRFDAGMFRDRQDQINFLDKRVADHMAKAGEDGVITTPSGSTITIDSDRSSPTYGRKKVTGSEVKLSSDRRNDMIRYKQARKDGSVYESSEGKVVDFGVLNKNREAYQKRKQEREDNARELRTRRAQLMNYGRTGGVTVAPGGGIAGPMTVGTQATFGPNMSLNQATLMAQRQLDQEERASDALRRVDQQQAIQDRLQAAQAMQDGPEKDAVLQQISNDVLQPSDSAQVKPTPASARAKAERQVELNDAQQRQADEIAENPISFYDDQMVALEGLETDEELDAYFNSEEGGVVYTPEQLLELNEQQILGLDQQLQNVGREGAKQAGRSAGQFFGGPIGGFLGGLAGEYLMPNEGIGFTFGEEEIKEKRATLERHNKKLKEYIARRNQR